MRKQNPDLMAHTNIVLYSWVNRFLVRNKLAIRRATHIGQQDQMISKIKYINL